MIQKFLISLGITALVSGLIAALFVTHWILVFLLAFVVQVMAFYIGNTIYENRTLLKAEQIRIEQLKEAVKQVALVECPCGQKNRQDVIVRFDENVTYKCSECNKTIKLDIDIKPVLTTEPIYTQK